MAVPHETITDPKIHEPKGAAAANAGEVYKADGLGSGVWTAMPRILTGFWDYNDAATTGTPIAVPGTLAYVYITNDAAGADTNLSYIPDEFTTAIWNTTTQRFDWDGSGCQLGDMINIRTDFEIITTAANQYVEVDIEMDTLGTPYDLVFYEGSYKTAGTHHINRYNGIYMGNASTLTGGAKFKVKSDAAATLVVNGWYINVIAPRT